MGTAAQTAILVFGREPVPGRVKTRLAASWGPDSACAMYAALLMDTLATCLSVREAATYFCHADAGLAPGFAMALASLPLAGVFAQTQAGDLGERLADAFQAVFRAGVQAAIVIGSDLPTLEADDLARATAATRPGQLTVGPARDGGYYLLGLDRRDFEPHLFSGIRWSTETVLAQTLERVAAASLAVVKLREQADWDEQGDVDPQQVSPAFRCTRAALADRFGDGRALRC